MPKKRSGVKPKKLTKAQMLRLMHGQGFFGDLWSGIKSVGRKIGDFAKDKLTKPSTYMTLGSLIPGPFSTPLGIAGTLTGLAGHGRRRKVRRGGARPASGVIRM